MEGLAKRNGSTLVWVRQDGGAVVRVLQRGQRATVMWWSGFEVLVVDTYAGPDDDVQSMFPQAE